MSIQGLQLEVTVVGCTRLKDKEWFSRQDPYVSIEYGSAKFRTRTCTDGGKNPSFQEKFSFMLMEGLSELNVSVWNSHRLTADDFIGSGRIQLQKVLSQGYDDNTWSIQCKQGRYAGDVRVILHCPNFNKQVLSHTVSISSMTHPVHHHPVQPHFPSFPPTPSTFPPSVFPPQPFPPTTYPPQSYPPHSGPCPGVYPPPSF